jgi:excisionase family DNA binding protein
LLRLYRSPTFGGFVPLLGHGTSGTLASTEGGANDDAAGGTPVERVRDREALLEELVGNGVLPENMRGRLLRTREVALLFQVSERAVTDWARRGRIPSVRTPGGHRRYPADEVWALLRRSEAGE